jgi:hypothetical protein
MRASAYTLKRGDFEFRQQGGRKEYREPDRQGEPATVLNVTPAGKGILRSPSS